MKKTAGCREVWENLYKKSKVSKKALHAMINEPMEQVKSKMHQIKDSDFSIDFVPNSVAVNAFSRKYGVSEEIAEAYCQHSFKWNKASNAVLKSDGTITVFKTTESLYKHFLLKDTGVFYGEYTSIYKINGRCYAGDQLDDHIVKYIEKQYKIPPTILNFLINADQKFKFLFSKNWSLLLLDAYEVEVLIGNDIKKQLKGLINSFYDVDLVAQCINGKIFPPKKKRIKNHKKKMTIFPLKQWKDGNELKKPTYII